MAAGYGRELVAGDIVERRDLNDLPIEHGLVISSTGSEERPGIGFLWGTSVELMTADDVELFLGTTIFVSEPMLCCSV